MLYLLAILAALFALSKTGFLASVGSGQPLNVPPQGYAVPPQAGGQQAEFNAAAQASTALNVVPVVGPALAKGFQALLSVFAAASAQRAAAARDENSAVAQAVPGWDQAIAQIANAYNQGVISAAQASAALDAVWRNFWAEVGPHIQSGRNACRSGTVVQDKSGPSYCGTAGYGAACCVGYDDLDNSNVNMKNAIARTENTGKPAPALVLPVFASKYGGINRPGYTVTFARPLTGFTL